MKRFAVTFLMFILCTFACFAAQMPFIKFNGNKFFLYFSAKSPEIGSYINEYYKPKESYLNWTELIAVHHYPNAYLPIDHAKLFQEFINSTGSSSRLDVNENDNSAVLDFIVIGSKKFPMIVEYNIFKYEKSHVCGTSALQYARRYNVNTISELKTLRKSLEKSRDKYIKQVLRISVPDLITTDVERGHYVNTEGIVDEPDDEFK